MKNYFIVCFGLWFGAVCLFPVFGETKVFENSKGELFRYNGATQTLEVLRYFKDNGDDTVTDERTGLMWQQDDDGKEYTHKSAIRFCENLSLAGFSDWHLPDIDALKTLLWKEKASRPYIDTAFFPSARSNWYWSSSVHVSKSDKAWSVDFFNGNVSWHYQAYEHYVRCVRSGK